MSYQEPQRRIHVPPGHHLRATGTESIQSDGLETQLSYFEVVDAAGMRVGSYVVRAAQSTHPPFESSVIVEAVG